MRTLKLGVLSTLLLANSVVLLLVLSVRVTPAQAARDGAVAGLNGDTNGDGLRDVSDAVRLLQFLFQDGPAPVPIACAEESDLAMRVDVLELELADLESPCEGRVDRFVENGDGTITDQCSGLMWSSSPVAAGVDHKEARSAALASDLAGFDDWRLPTADELARLVRPEAARWNPSSLIQIQGHTGNPLWASTAVDGLDERQWFWSFSLWTGGLVPLPSTDGIDAVLVRDPK